MFPIFYKLTSHAGGVKSAYGFEYVKKLRIVFSPFMDRSPDKFMETKKFLFYEEKKAKLNLTFKMSIKSIYLNFYTYLYTCVCAEKEKG